MRKHQNDWLLLMHQIPPKQDSFRVKVWRLLLKVGALQLKNSVYVLPFSGPNQQKFEAIVQEVNSNNGDAFLCRSTFVKGIESVEIVEKFNRDREEKYELFGKDLKLLQKIVSSGDVSENELMEVEHSIGKIDRQIQELVNLDFFKCKLQEPTLKVLQNVLRRIESHRSSVKGAIFKRDLSSFQRKIWVTRSDIHVDRMASAWLISRFIDKKPIFKFVNSNKYQAEKIEVCFDMFSGEFTHVGDKCTFEVLAESFGLKRKSLTIIAEIIHDLDLKDTKFNRPEALGLGMVFKSIAVSEYSDEVRMKKANDLLDGLVKEIE